MAGSGSCACGSVAFAYSGDYALTALCHCTDCQKWSGSAFSSNVVVPTANFSIAKVSPKGWNRTGLVTGKEHRLFCCGECGSNLYSQPEGMPGITQIKTGSLLEKKISIMAEIFVTGRQDYVTAVSSAKQVAQMP